MWRFHDVENRVPITDVLSIFYLNVVQTGDRSRCAADDTIYIILYVTVAVLLKGAFLQRCHSMENPAAANKPNYSWVCSDKLMSMHSHN